VRVKHTAYSRIQQTAYSVQQETTCILTTVRGNDSIQQDTICHMHCGKFAGGEQLLSIEGVRPYCMHTTSCCAWMCVMCMLCTGGLSLLLRSCVRGVEVVGSMKWSAGSVAR
jgi:hypothetical protein